MDLYVDEWILKFSEMHTSTERVSQYPQRKAISCYVLWRGAGSWGVSVYAYWALRSRPRNEHAFIIWTYFNIASCHNRANADPNIPPRPDYISQHILTLHPRSTRDIRG